MRKLFFSILFILTLAISVHAQLFNPLSGAGSSLGVTMFSEDKSVQPGVVILTAKVRLEGKNITAAAPSTGSFTVPCGLAQADLVLNIQLLADQLKLLKFKGKEVKIADLEIEYSEGGAYRPCDFNELLGWSASIPLDAVEPDIRVISFIVYYKAGRNHTKLFGFITVASSDARNSVQAARTLAFAEYEGPANRESVWQWQVLMGGATLTGQALPAGGVAPLFTPSSVKAAMQAVSQGTQSKQNPSNDTLTISADQAQNLIASVDPQGSRVVEKPAAPKATVKPVVKPSSLCLVRIAPYKGTKEMGVYLYSVTAELKLVVQYGNRTETIVVKAGGHKFIDLRDNLTVSVTLGGKTKVIFDQGTLVGHLNDKDILEVQTI